MDGSRPECTSHMLSNLYSFPELLTIPFQFMTSSTWLEGLHNALCYPGVVYKLNLEIKCQQLVVTLYQMSLLFAQLDSEESGEFCRADASFAK